MGNPEIRIRLKHFYQDAISNGVDAELVCSIEQGAWEVCVG